MIQNINILKNTANEIKFKDYKSVANSNFNNGNNYYKNTAPFNYPKGFTPVFKGISIENKFSNLLDKMIEKPETFDSKKEILSKYIDELYLKIYQNKPMGEGHFGIVYRINDKYVLKANKNPISKNIKLTRPPKSTFFSSLKTYCGEPVLVFENFEILKNADPKGTATNVGVHINSNEINIIKNDYNKYLEKCANLPQKTFDDIAKDFKTLNEMQTIIKKNDKDYKINYSFDYTNPNNFLITEDSLKIVDEIYETSQKDRNNLSSMFDVFLNYYKKDIQTDFDESIVNQRKQIFKKCILACEKAGIDLPSDEIENKYSLNHTFMLIGQDFKYPILRNNIKRLRNDIPDINQRITELENILNRKFDITDTIN